MYQKYPNILFRFISFLQKKTRVPRVISPICHLKAHSPYLWSLTSINVWNHSDNNCMKNFHSKVVEEFENLRYVVFLNRYQYRLVRTIRLTLWLVYRILATSFHPLSPQMSHLPFQTVIHVHVFKFDLLNYGWELCCMPNSGRFHLYNTGQH